MTKRMPPFLLACLLVLAAAARAAAQDERPNRKELRDALADPDSFGDTVRFLSLGNTSFVILDPTCDPEDIGPLEPNDRCVVLNPAPAPTDFDERGLGHITLPGNSARTVVYQTVINLFNYQFFNDSAATRPTAIFRYQPYLTIESDALKDPRAVDPVTGDPLDGKLDVTVPAYIVNRSLAPSERARTQQNYSRAGIAGLSKAVFVGNGIPPDIVDRMFRQTMTIRLNVRGRAQNVSDAFMAYSLRLMGN